MGRDHQRPRVVRGQRAQAGGGREVPDDDHAVALQPSQQVARNLLEARRLRGVAAVAVGPDEDDRPRLEAQQGHLEGVEARQRRLGDQAEDPVEVEGLRHRLRDLVQLGHGRRLLPRGGVQPCLLDRERDSEGDAGEQPHVVLGETLRPAAEQSQHPEGLGRPRTGSHSPLCAPGRPAGIRGEPVSVVRTGEPVRTTCSATWSRTTCPGGASSSGMPRAARWHSRPASSRTSSDTTSARNSSESVDSTRSTSVGRLAGSARTVSTRDSRVAWRSAVWAEAIARSRSSCSACSGAPRSQRHGGHGRVVEPLAADRARELAVGVQPEGRQVARGALQPLRLLPARCAWMSWCRAQLKASSTPGGGPDRSSAAAASRSAAASRVSEEPRMTCTAAPAGTWPNAMRSSSAISGRSTEVCTLRITKDPSGCRSPSGAARAAGRAPRAPARGGRRGPRAAPRRTRGRRGARRSRTRSRRRCG